MKISPLCVVALTWTLTDAQGELLDRLDEPVEFLVGGGDLLEHIDQALQGQAAGASLDLHLEPEQAFGDYDEKLVFLEPRDLFPAELEDGMVFEGLPAGCSVDAPRNRLYHVSGIYPEHVVVDGNHPLAGIALRLQLKVSAVREASEAETGRGSLSASFFRTQ
jgi:FKBP-type peptidyl-prolyl cis-trans isomerase SlyD